jgi:hypothetical protein
MGLRHAMLPAFVLGVGLFMTGCGNAGDTRNRTADHTGAMNGTGGTMDSGKGTGSALDRRNRTGSETGMNSGDRSTTGGGTSLSGSERGNNPNRRDANR